MISVPSKFTSLPAKKIVLLQQLQTPFERLILQIKPIIATIIAWMKSLFKPQTISDLTPQIAKRAYELYERRGRHEGFALQDWLRAEQEVQQRSKKTCRY